MASSLVVARQATSAVLSIISDGETQSVLTTITRSIEESITKVGTTFTTTFVQTIAITDAAEYSSLEASESSASTTAATTSTSTRAGTVTGETPSSSTSSSTLTQASNKTSNYHLVVAIVVPILVFIVGASYVWFLLRLRRRSKQLTEAHAEPEADQMLSQTVEIRHAEEKASRTVRVTEEAIEVTPPRKAQSNAEGVDSIRRASRRSPSLDYGFGPMVQSNHAAEQPDARAEFGPLPKG